MRGYWSRVLGWCRQQPGCESTRALTDMSPMLDEHLAAPLAVTRIRLLIR